MREIVRPFFRILNSKNPRMASVGEWLWSAAPKYSGLYCKCLLPSGTGGWNLAPRALFRVLSPVTSFVLAAYIGASQSEKSQSGVYP